MYKKVLQHLTLRSNPHFPISQASLLRHVLHAPVQDSMENGKQVTSFLRQAILDMWRNLIELLSADNAFLLKFAQGIRQHRIRKTRKKLPKLTETHRTLHAKQVNDLHLPLALQVLQDARHRTMPLLCQDKGIETRQKFFIRDLLIHKSPQNMNL
mgnify:FL=1